jgi:hypothetical protein
VAAAEWRARPGEGEFWNAYKAHSRRKKQETAQANPGLTTVSVSEIPGDMALLYSHEARSNLIRIIIGTYHYLDWPSSDADGGASAAANVNLNGVAAVGKELNTGDTGDQGQLGQAGSTQDVPQTFESFLSRQH